jgi:hypothetical protein
MTSIVKSALKQMRAAVRYVTVLPDCMHRARPINVETVNIQRLWHNKVGVAVTYCMACSFLKNHCVRQLVVAL